MGWAMASEAKAATAPAPLTSPLGQPGQLQASAFPWASPEPLPSASGPQLPVGSYLLQFTLVLGLLMALLWLSGRLAKGGPKGAWPQALAAWGLGPKAGPSSRLSLEARIPLDAERTAYVVACEGQRWLLAGGPGALVVVAELDPQANGAEPAVPGGFESALSHRVDAERPPA